MPLHLLKTAMGSRDFAALERRARVRSASGGVVRTRNTPKRLDELLDGGSLYWVAGGMILARQRILSIVREEDAGPRPTAIALHGELVRVSPRRMGGLQGWRYLSDPPPDVGGGSDPSGVDQLPDHLMRALREACLI